MLSSIDIQEILKDIPVGFKTSGDDYFTATASILPTHKKLGVLTNTEDEKNENGTATEIYCNVPGCKLIFEGVADYQMHFNSVHRQVCIECKRSLPTAHLLDLHLSENHDSYFAARVARGESMFGCFLEECKLKTATAAERKEHCISAHKFPANFRFDQLDCGKVNTARKQQTKDKNVVHHTMDIVTDCEAVARETTKDTLIKSTESERKIKEFTFGHQREKTFQFKRRQIENKQIGGGKTLENLNDMKQALESLN